MANYEESVRHSQLIPVRKDDYHAWHSKDRIESTNIPKDLVDMKMLEAINDGKVKKISDTGKPETSEISDANKVPEVIEDTSGAKVTESVKDYNVKAPPVTHQVSTSSIITSRNDSNQAMTPNNNQPSVTEENPQLPAQQENQISAANVIHDSVQGGAQYMTHMAGSLLVPTLMLTILGAPLAGTGIALLTLCVASGVVGGAVGGVRSIYDHGHAQSHPIQESKQAQVTTERPSFISMFRHSPSPLCNLSAQHRSSLASRI